MYASFELVDIVLLLRSHPIPNRFDHFFFFLFKIMIIMMIDVVFSIAFESDHFCFGYCNGISN